MRSWVNFTGLLCGALAASCVTGAAADGGPAFIERSATAPIQRQGLWRPAATVELQVRVRCDGAGGGRACRIEIARAAQGAAEQMLAIEPCGTAIPLAGVDSDRTVLVLVGEDARGGWRQAARYIAERDTIQWTRRRYDDGL